MTEGWSIADVLEATADEALAFLNGFIPARAASKAVGKLKFLQDVGLGYLRLGQPINTLSGGECQRLKLVRHLTEIAPGLQPATTPILFLFDEPTTGLHFEDVQILVQVLQKLVEAGHSVVVIEHNIDLIKSSDWIIDMGPEGGEAGGKIVAQGTPEIIAASGTHTGRAISALN